MKINCLVMKYCIFLFSFCLYIPNQGIAGNTTLSEMALTFNNLSNNQLEEDFLLLTQLKGELYLKKRNQFLKQPDILPFLEKHRTDSAWENQIQAKILISWLRHKPLYDSI